MTAGVDGLGRVRRARTSRTVADPRSAGPIRIGPMPADQATVPGQQRGRRDDALLPQLAWQSKDQRGQHPPGRAGTGAVCRPGGATRPPHGAAPTVRRPSRTRPAPAAVTSRTSEPRSGTPGEQPCTRSWATSHKRQLIPRATSYGTAQATNGLDSARGHRRARFRAEPSARPLRTRYRGAARHADRGCLHRSRARDLTRRPGPAQHIH